jgi:hypothetical protein
VAGWLARPRGLTDGERLVLDDADPHRLQDVLEGTDAVCSGEDADGPQRLVSGVAESVWDHRRDEQQRARAHLSGVVTDRALTRAAEQDDDLVLAVGMCSEGVARLDLKVDDTERAGVRHTDEREGGSCAGRRIFSPNLAM